VPKPATDRGKMTQSRPGQGAPLRRTIASALNAKSAET
jgi:hypothetical protein